MENQKQNNEKQGSKKGKSGLTVVGYILLILALVTIAPVVCPPIFGYHTYTVSSDNTGLISSNGSVVYTKSLGSYEEGNMVAVDNQDGDRDVDVYYVEANDADAKQLVLEGGTTVAYDQIHGRVVAKTPFIGYLCQLNFSIIGIIVIVAAFVAGLFITIKANKMAKEAKEAEKEQCMILASNFLDMSLLQTLIVCAIIIGIGVLVSVLISTLRKKKK